MLAGSEDMEARTNYLRSKTLYLSVFGARYHRQTLRYVSLSGSVPPVRFRLKHRFQLPRLSQDGRVR